jgi:hypothetical protein
MARTYKRKREYTEQDKAEFAAQRQQTMQSLAERMSAAVAAIQDSEAFKAYLRTQARFHRYSFRNTLLILSQCRVTTFFRGKTPLRAKRLFSALECVEPRFSLGFKVCSSPVLLLFV